MRKGGFSGGNGKGGVPTSLPQAVRVGIVRVPGTPLFYCVLALVPRFLSITITKPIGRSARSAFPEVLLAPPTPLPCFYPHSQWAAMGPVQVGVRSQAQVHHTVTDLGCWGAAIYSAISGGSARHTQSPEQGVGCFAYETSRDVCLLASALSTQCWLCFLLWLPECGCSEWLCLGGLLLDLGRLRCFRGRRAMA